MQRYISATYVAVVVVAVPSLYVDVSVETVTRPYTLKSKQCLWFRDWKHHHTRRVHTYAYRTSAFSPRFRAAAAAYAP